MSVPTDACALCGRARPAPIHVTAPSDALHRIDGFWAIIEASLATAKESGLGHRDIKSANMRADS